MKPTAILLLHCPDQQGIISEVTRFITDNQGNIVYLDQYVDKQDGMFFMRIEWELENFLIPREKIQEYINTLYAQRYQMTCKLYFSDKRPRMAIFVSKMSHCLYDLLARWKAGEWDIDIPCIISNHEDLRYVAEQFDIPYYVWSIKKDHSNKAEVEAAEMELLRKENIIAQMKNLANPETADVMGDLQKMLGALKALPTQPRIYLCKPIPALKDSWTISESVITGEIVPLLEKAVKKEKLEGIIDLHAAFEGHPEMMQDDGIHPNAAGVRKMAETVAKVIDPEAKIEQRPFWMMR